MQHNNKGVIGGVMSHPVAFAGAFVLLFTLSFMTLAVADALPEPITNDITNAAGPDSLNTVEVSNPESPVRVVAEAIGLDATVANPSSTNVHTLDAALLKGAVRYPTTALLGEEGTMLLFGHSSYLPIVHNQVYKTFNNIQKLEKGDIVSVLSSTAEYRYKVIGVRVADATEDVVELRTTGRHLVLITCDSFTAKTSRFVVTAEFVGTYSLAN
ncbi:MAG: sortase [Candidatus Adlerbacteria bacterium]|nr:sortase [Candidatus Adlerbacteria bacterium]